LYSSWWIQNHSPSSANGGSELGWVEDRNLRFQVCSWECDAALMRQQAKELPAAAQLVSDRGTISPLHIEAIAAPFTMRRDAPGAESCGALPVVMLVKAPQHLAPT
jgi:hypothetical protein